MTPLRDFQSISIDPLSYHWLIKSQFMYFDDLFDSQKKQEDQLTFVCNNTTTLDEKRMSLERLKRSFFFFLTTSREEPCCRLGRHPTISDPEAITSFLGLFYYLISFLVSFYSCRRWYAEIFRLSSVVTAISIEKNMKSKSEKSQREKKGKKSRRNNNKKGRNKWNVKKKAKEN